tara:strand:- start:475 stop:690 length:216 start_codon:yes stop_codon:yes gene_type:complete
MLFCIYGTQSRENVKGILTEIYAIVGEFGDSLLILMSSQNPILFRDAYDAIHHIQSFYGPLVDLVRVAQKI